MFLVAQWRGGFARCPPRASSSGAYTERLTPAAKPQQQCVCTLALAQESARDEPFMPPPLRVNERPKPEDESCANC